MLPGSLRFGVGPALVLQSFRGQALGASGSRTLGFNPQPLGRPADCIPGKAARVSSRIAGLPNAHWLISIAAERTGGATTEPGFQKISSGFAAEDGRLFLDGVHAERSAADLFGWARERCRRSTQGSEQSRRPCDRNRFALSTRVFPAGNRRTRPAAGPLSIQRPWPIADRGPCGKPNGEWLRFHIDLVLAPSLWIRAWQVQVG